MVVYWLGIVEVVRQCEISKSLDPDGYNFLFIKNNWEILKVEVVGVIIDPKLGLYILEDVTHLLLFWYPRKWKLVIEYRYVSWEYDRYRSADNKQSWWWKNS